MPEVQRVTDQADPDKRFAGKDMAVEPGPGAGGDQQHRAQGRQQGPPARKVAFGVDGEQHDDQQRQAGPRPQVVAPVPLGHAVFLGGHLVAEDGFPAHTVHMHGRQHGPDHQFPETRDRVVEGGGG
ncbi:hypothetical protein D9M68_670610 [compost metagenome]